MKKLALLLGIVLMFMFSGCSPQEVQPLEQNSQESSMFVVVEKTMIWKVVYNKETKVMYVVSEGSRNEGMFTKKCLREATESFSSVEELRLI